MFKIVETGYSVFTHEVISVVEDRTELIGVIFRSFDNGQLGLSFEEDAYLTADELIEISTMLRGMES